MIPLIRLENVSKYYKTSSGVSEGMRKVNLELYNGEFVAITGESGAGKTTLLNVLSGLDSYEDGELYINGKETSHYTIKDWEHLRANNIGFIFQNYNIIEAYTVYQNVAIALEAQNYPAEKIKARSLELIEKVGLLSHKDQKTTRLSGGEKQRVVIARALAKDAPIILADEPTGNLDEKTSVEILNLLKDLSADKLVVLVTHNLKLAEEVATRNVVMEDGGIKNDFTLEEINKTSFNLLEEPITKNRLMKKTTKIATRNILSTPKKTIFQLLLAIITITAFLFLYSEIVANTLNNLVSPKNQFSSVLTIKRDKSDFTKEELLNLKHKKIRQSFEHSNYFLKTLTISGFNEQIKPSYSSVLKESDLKMGRLPERIKEVVIYHPYDKHTYVLNTEIRINGEMFEIVGITNKFKYDWYMEVYFNEKYFFNEDLEITTHGIKFFTEEPKFDSLYTVGLDRIDIVNYKNKINNNTYQIVDKYLIIEQDTKFILGTLTFFLWLVLLAILQVIFLVTYNVQKNIMRTRITDFAVYRSIGISEKEVAVTILIEQVIIALIGTIITILVFRILGIFVDSFYRVNRNIDLFNYFIIALVFTLFSIRQGLKFNKKIFNTTVIEALKEED